MSIIHQATDFIQQWEKDCQESEFTLRFPVFADFLSYLQENTTVQMYMKITSDQALLNNLRSFFYALLRAHIQDLCIQEEIREERLSIAYVSSVRFSHDKILRL